MKQLIILALSRFFHFLKFKSLVAYTAVYGALLGLQHHLADPAVMQEILASLHGAPGWVISLVQMAPTIIMGLLSPHTSEKVKEYRDRKRIKKQYGTSL